MLTDANGVPLVVQTTPANVPDQRQLETLLDPLPTVKKPIGRPRRKPDGILGDRADGTEREIALVEWRGIESFLAERSGKTHGSGLGTLPCVLSPVSCLSLCLHFRGITPTNQSRDPKPTH